MKYCLMFSFGFVAGMYLHDKLMSIYNNFRGFNKPPSSPEVK